MEEDRSLLNALIVLIIIQSSVMVVHVQTTGDTDTGQMAELNPPYTPAVEPAQAAVPPTTTLAPSTPSTPATPAPAAISARLLWKYATGDSVYGVGVSSNGEYVAAGSSDNRVYLLNKTGDLLWNYRTKGGVRDVAITPDAGAIVAVSFLIPDGHLYLLDKKGNITWERNVIKLMGVDITSDRALIAGASDDGNIYTFNGLGDDQGKYKTGESAWGVWDVAFSADGRYIAAGADDKNVYLLDTIRNVLWKKNPSKKSYIYGVGISGNGEYVAAAAQNRHIYVFDKSGNLLWSYQTGSSNYGVAISEDGRYVALGSWDKTIYVFDIRGNIAWQMKLGGYVNRVAFSPDGRYLAAGSSDDNVYLFELDLG